MEWPRATRRPTPTPADGVGEELAEVLTHGERSSQCALRHGHTARGPCEGDAAACDYSAAADHEGAGNPSGVALYAKEFFNQILSINNANQDIIKEAQKRLSRDLSGDLVVTLAFLSISNSYSPFLDSSLASCRTIICLE